MSHRVLCAVVLSAVLPARALACATCGSGDPTLTVMGSDAPFAERLRVSVDLQVRRDVLAGGTTIDEGLLQLGASYAPTGWLTLSMIAPVVLRDVGFADLSRATTAGLGQLDLRGRFVLFRDRPFAPEHLVGLVLGLALPTVVDQRTPNGTLLGIDAQSGSGTLDPLAGAFYTWLADPFSVFASATVRVPIFGRYPESPGVSGSATLALQIRASSWLTLRVGADGRIDAPSTEDGHAVPGSEHAVLFVSPDLLVALSSELLAVLGVRMPVAEHAPDGRIEGPYAHLGLVGDL